MGMWGGSRKRQAALNTERKLLEEMKAKRKEMLREEF
jgi:hypothetical protein